MFVYTTETVEPPSTTIITTNNNNNKQTDNQQQRQQQQQQLLLLLLLLQVKYKHHGHTLATHSPTRGVFRGGPNRRAPPLNPANMRLPPNGEWCSDGRAVLE